MAYPTTRCTTERKVRSDSCLSNDSCRALYVLLMSIRLSAVHHHYVHVLATAWQQRSHAAALLVGPNTLPAMLALWRAWRAEVPTRGRLHLVWVAQLGEHEVALRTCFDPLAEEISLPVTARVPGILRLELEAGCVLTLAVGDPSMLLPRLAGGFDGLWLHIGQHTTDAVRASGRLMREGAMVVVEGVNPVDPELLQTLRRAGFALEHGSIVQGAQQGFPELPRSEVEASKIVQAVFRPPWRSRRRAPPNAASYPERTAVVIGAGLAGCAMAHRLVARGWRVMVFDRAGGPARCTSAHRAAALHPHLSPDDSHLSRLTRAGHHYALAHWSALDRAGHPVNWQNSGLLQVAMSEDESELQRRTLMTLSFPPEFVRWLGPDAARCTSGAQVTYGGWWFGLGGWVAPPDICRAQLDDVQGRVTLHWNTQVGHLERTGNGWQLYDAEHCPLAHVPVVVMACGGDALSLLPPTGITLTPIPGQLTDIPRAVLDASVEPWPHAVIAGHGYALPATGEGARIGATYEAPNARLTHLAAATENLARASELLPGWGEQFRALNPGALKGFSGMRWVTHNRCPHIGQLPDATAARSQAAQLRGAHLNDIPRFPGLFGLLGLASRGLTWAALGAELIACQIEGEPWPIEADLAASIDPARALLYELRHPPEP
jgi:tRNA 5-methylaminomethyl-2-thiouridine biosynthesis bifunctional protein